MKITCIHGYFIFREQSVGEIAKFNSLYDQDLTAFDDYYTFSLLVDSPIYTISGTSWLGVLANASFCGKPWELMRENSFVYNVQSSQIVAISTVTNRASITRTYADYLARGLIQPGSFDANYQRITGYNGILDFSTLNFYYSELFYD